MIDRRDIQIASVGRFHYDALAVGLDACERLQCFYSGMPRGRLRCEPIARHRVATRPWLQAPYLALNRLGVLPLAQLNAMARRAQQDLDRWIAARLGDGAVYAAMSGCGLESGRMARRRGMRHVCERGAEHIRQNELLLAAEAERWGIRRTPTDSRMMAIEEAEYAEADVLLVTTPRNIDGFVARGIDPARIRAVPPVLRTFGTPGAPDRGADFKVLFVGALSLNKGLGYLAEAYARADLPAASLTLIGSPCPETEALLAPLDGRAVVRTGPLPAAAVFDHMRSAHVLVIPSMTDGINLTLLEGLACGCTVIVSDLCGGSEFVRDGDNALVVPAGDSDALAQALVRLEEDRDLLRTLSARGLRVKPGGDGPHDYAVRWIDAVTATG